MEILFICANIFSLFSLVNCTFKCLDCQFFMLAFPWVIVAAIKFLIIQLAVCWVDTSVGKNCSPNSWLK